MTNLAKELEEINYIPNVSHKNKISLCLDFEKEEKRFVDFTHDGLGRIGRLYYNFKTKRYDFEPTQNQIRNQ